MVWRVVDEVGVGGGVRIKVIQITLYFIISSISHVSIVVVLSKRGLHK